MTFAQPTELASVSVSKFSLDIVAGASDDIRRATELAYRSVSEFGLSAAVGPLAVASMAGDDGAFMLRDSGSYG